MLNNITSSIKFFINTSYKSVYPILRTKLLFMILYAIIVVYIQIHFDYLFDQLEVYNIGQFHLIFSFVLAVLIAFRMNSSYIRWWEGRSAWGEVVNNCRNLAIKMRMFTGEDKNSDFVKMLKIFPKILRSHLRHLGDGEIILREINIEVPGGKHLPLFLLAELFKIINAYRIENKISFEQYLVLDAHLANLTNNLGVCEKILTTPIPITIKLFVQLALYSYMIIFPIGWAEKFGYFIIPILIVIMYVLFGLELVAEDMEEPFSNKVKYNTSSGLNLENISKTIEQNINEIYLN